VLDQLEDAKQDIQLPEYLANSRFHKGSYEGLRAWGICQLVRLGAVGAGAAGKGKGKKGAADEEVAAAGSSKAGKAPSSLTVRRFYRPEDISREQSYKAGSYYEVYASGAWVGAAAGWVHTRAGNNAGCSWGQRQFGILLWTHTSQ
jgi:hypothetical protein